MSCPYKKRIGFTNKMAIVLMIMLVAFMTGSFVLAFYSIRMQYLGALACWTIVATPIGTAIGIVLAKIVDKSKAENTSGGINYLAATKTESANSPEI